MDIKYNDGNYLISNNLSNISYAVNTNNTNNRLIYSFNIFPFSNMQYINHSIYLSQLSILYKLDIYYSFQFLNYNNNAKVINAIDDYDILDIVLVNNNYKMYSSINYSLTHFLNSTTPKYYLVDKKTKTKYYFNDYANYPYKIEYIDGRIETINLSYSQITSIECNGERIVFNTTSTTLEMTSQKYNNLVLIGKTKLQLLNNNNLRINFNVYDYDSNDEIYVEKYVTSFNINNSSSILTIEDLLKKLVVKFIYSQSKIITIDEGYIVSNTTDIVSTTSISYNNYVTTIQKDNKIIKLFYDNNNMIRYIIDDNKYIKYYTYNNDYLLSYESNYVKNVSLFNNNLLSFDIENYYDEDDQEYEFDIDLSQSQTIPTDLASFIDSNDIFHIEGYGSLYKEIYKYGEENDDTSLLFFYKIISGNFYVEIRYYGESISHTFLVKQINSNINNDFSPFIMGLKPSYLYNKIKISLLINGEIYINTPKINRYHMGNYYFYDNNYNISTISSTNGLTNYTYNSNNNITKKETTENIVTYVRDSRENILTETLDDYEITKTYDAYNRVLTISDTNYTYLYNYQEEIVDGEYKFRINKYKENQDNTTTLIESSLYDNNGRLLYYQNYETDRTDSYSYNGACLIYKRQNQINSNMYYNIYNNISQIEDNYNNSYNFLYTNNKISTVKYRNNNILASITYDNKDRVITKSFNGTYNISYLENPKQNLIYYNNNLKYTINYNNYDLVTSDGYNSIIYDDNDNLEIDFINLYYFYYLKNSLGYKSLNNTIYNYLYTNKIYGYSKLKDDPYYANITYHNDSDINVVNSSNTTILKYDDKFYQLSNNLLSTSNDGEPRFQKQDYKLFYYDSTIDSYATLLYGTKIKYETEIYNEGIIELEFKLENRNLEQLIIRLKSSYRDIKLYRDTNNKLNISTSTNNTYNSNYIISSNAWYKIKIKLITTSLYVYIKGIDDESYTCYTYTIQTYNDDEFYIELGKTDNYYNLMTTFGLIRNLYFSTSIIRENSYINVYKNDEYSKYNELKYLRFKYENKNSIDVVRDVFHNEQTSYVHNHENERLKLIRRKVYNRNNNSLNEIIIFDTYMNNYICYENIVDIDLPGTLLNGIKYYSYTYDSRNRLTKEDIYLDHGTSNYLYGFSYEYDASNNITKYKELDSNNTILKQIQFNYNSSCKYRLDSISVTENNSTTTYNVTYDNTTGLLPISFMGNSFTYEGKRLIGYNNYNYEYNVYGRRIRKYLSDNSIDIKYYYDVNNNLLFEDRGTYKIKYLYDTNNEIYSLVFDRSINTFDINVYFYIKDEHGVIHAISDVDGNIIGRYEYNGYGLITNIIQNNDTLNIMNINPLRYKTYYYDIESEMYYLNNRYYNPMLCRFITPDSYEYIEVTNVDSYNLYTYCYNNPVMYSDPEGNYGILTALFVGALIGAAVGGAFETTKQLFNNGGDWSKLNLGTIVSSVFLGGVLGAVGGIGSSTFGTFLAGASTMSAFKIGGWYTISMGLSFAGGFLGYSIDKGINKDEWKLNEALINGGMAMISGTFSFVVGSFSKVLYFQTSSITEKITNQFFTDVFSQPITWLLDLLIRKL